MNVRAAVLGCLAVLAAGCSGKHEVALESAELNGADETISAPGYAPTGCVQAATRLETAAALNLREGPSTEARLLLVVPEGTALSVGDSTCPENGFYKVRFGGFEGWAYGAWLHASTATLESALSYANTRPDAMARARTAVGFSYWWGGGRWLETGATSTNKGVCTGSCPSCSHSGSYGADCSGFAAKVWVVPSTNQPLSFGSHPYSTAVFDNEYHGWHNVARSSVQMADAMVYNENGAGHIFIYEKADPWGRMYAYECKGCAEGCVYNIRTASTSYKAISRDDITNPTPPPPPPSFTGAWYLRDSNTSGTSTIPAFSYGQAGDLPIVGDWNGDGTSTIGVLRGTTWYLRDSNSAGGHTIPSFAYGNVGDIPVVGDWNGDGIDTIGVVRDTTWYLRDSNSAGGHTIPSFAYGNVGDIPVVGDWNGDGIDTIGVFRNGTWYLRDSNSAGGHTIVAFAYGQSGDVPVVGDWNGDGIDTVGVVRGTMWYLRDSNSAGGHTIVAFGYGNLGDLPVVGDWNGDRLTTVGVAR